METRDLWMIADKILDVLDVELLRSGSFVRRNVGTMAMVVDDTTGDDSGGGTNTLGYYTTAIFNNSIYPPGFCEKVPGLFDSDRCSDTVVNNFLVGPRDAIVMLGCTPPPSKYFSWDAIIDVRMTPELFFPGINFGDDINHLSIEREFNIESDEVFYQPVLTIHTADQKSAQMISDALTKLKLSIPAITRGFDETVRLWDRSADGGANWEQTMPDLLSILGRVSVPLPGFTDEYQRWKNHSWPMRLYSASDVASKPAKPFPSDLIPRQGTKESPVRSEREWLSEAFLALKASVNASWVDEGIYGHAEAHGCALMNFTVFGFYDDWDAFLQSPQNDTFPAGTRDAIYGLPLPQGYKSWFYKPSLGAVIVGVLHEDAMGASYGSIGVSLYNGKGSMFGLSGAVYTRWFEGDEMRGSANRYLPKKYSSEAEYLFAIDILPPGGCKLSAHPQWCAEVNNTAIDYPSIPNPYWGLGERVYSLKSTGVGPAFDMIIGGEFLVYDFSKKH